MGHDKELITIGVFFELLPRPKRDEKIWMKRNVMVNKSGR